MLGLSPAEAWRGAWKSAQVPHYLRWTSRSAEKVDEQLVTSAHGTPAAISAPANRFCPRAPSALGDTTTAGARGRRANEGAFSEGTAGPASSSSPSSAPGVDQAGLRVALPWGRAPSAAGSGAWRPRLLREVAPPGCRHGPGDGRLRPHRIHINPGGKWASPSLPN